MDADAIIKRAAARYFQSHPRDRPAPCHGYLLCVDCPRPDKTPPYLAIPRPAGYYTRRHLERQPKHRLVFWCKDHLLWDCTRRTPVVGTRGGRRPGAGAPKGNANALRHGRRSDRQELRDLLALLPADVRGQLLPYLRHIAPKMQTIKRRLALARAGHRSAPANLLPFRPANPTTTTTTDAGQSNPHLNALANRAAAWGFIGAQAFVRAHSPGAHILNGILDDIDAQADAGAALPKNPGGLIRHLFHQEIADQGPTQLRCPYCPWTASLLGKEATP